MTSHGARYWLDVRLGQVFDGLYRSLLVVEETSSFKLKHLYSSFDQDSGLLCVHQAVSKTPCRCSAFMLS